MITKKEKEYIYDHSHIPEHVVDYVEAVTGAEAFLSDDYIYYLANNNLFFVGYPLKDRFEEKDMMRVFDDSTERTKPDNAALIAPSVSMKEAKCHRIEKDQYYRIFLSDMNVNKKTKNMIHRASRELSVREGREITDEHLELISEFTGSHRIDDERKYIFENISKYVSDVPTSLVFNAVDGKYRLAAFDVAEFGSGDYAFYMFNFRSSEFSVPGASDLLLDEVVGNAKAKGKTFLNLGLGMNEGNRFFKEKWGGIPFLDYRYCQYSLSKREGLLSLLMKF